MSSFQPLQHQAALYGQEAQQLSVARSQRQVEYEGLAQQQAAEIAHLAGLRRQLEHEIELRSQDLDRLRQAEVVAEAERARTSAEHDRAVQEETLRQRELESAITNTNNTIEAQKAAEFAAVQASRQAEAQQLDQINALKHQAFNTNTGHHQAQAELQARIQAAEAALVQSQADTQVREGRALSVGHPVHYTPATAVVAPALAAAAAAGTFVPALY